MDTRKLVCNGLVSEFNDKFDGMESGSEFLISELYSIEYNIRNKSSEFTTSFELSNKARELYEKLSSKDFQLSPSILNSMLNECEYLKSGIGDIDSLINTLIKNHKELTTQFIQENVSEIHEFSIADDVIKLKEEAATVANEIMELDMIINCVNSSCVSHAIIRDDYIAIVDEMIGKLQNFTNKYRMDDSGQIDFTKIANNLNLNQETKANIEQCIDVVSNIRKSYKSLKDMTIVDTSADDGNSDTFYTYLYEHYEYPIFETTDQLFKTFNKNEDISEECRKFFRTLTLPLGRTKKFGKLNTLIKLNKLSIFEEPNYETNCYSKYICDVTLTIGDISKSGKGIYLQGIPVSIVCGEYNRTGFQKCDTFDMKRISSYIQISLNKAIENTFRMFTVDDVLDQLD